jgi:hypothetical protein
MKTTIRVCWQCRSPFRSPRADVVFCSTKCGHASRGLPLSPAPVAPRKPRHRAAPPQHKPWMGLAAYTEQGLPDVPPPRREGEFPIQDTPTDCFSFSNC